MNYAHYFIEGKAVRIIPLGDIHIGSPQSRIKDVIKIIESADENVLFIFAGDVIDNALRDSVSDIYEQTENPHEALTEPRTYHIEYRELTEDETDHDIVNNEIETVMYHLRTE